MNHARTLVLTLALAAACKNSAPEPPASTAQSAPRAPSDHSMGALPPGHPSMGGAAMAPPAPTGRELRWSDPVGWRRVQPSSSMRRAQYAIPGATSGSDGELAVFWFGAGQGGSIEENVRRWHDQFVPEPSTPPGPPATTERTVHGLRVHLTERFGRFGGTSMPGGPAPSFHDDWGMLGAIVETDQGPWFFKLTGPRATVNAARARFDDLVASFQMP